MRFPTIVSTVLFSRYENGLKKIMRRWSNRDFWLKRDFARWTMPWRLIKRQQTSRCVARSRVLHDRSSYTITSFLPIKRSISAHRIRAILSNHGHAGTSQEASDLSNIPSCSYSREKFPPYKLFTFKRNDYFVVPSSKEIHVTVSM